MKHFNTFITLLLMLSFTSKSQNNQYSEQKVVKIINTKTFTTKTEFDELVADKPEYNLDKTEEDIEIYFTWFINHYDEYGNILKSISIMHDENGNEKTLYTTNNFYYSPKDNKLSYVKTEGDVNEEIKYIRDNAGNILQIEKYCNNEMIEKTKFTYNEKGQLVKEDEFEKNGITESIEYSYDQPSIGKSNIVKKIMKNLKHNFTQEYQYKWSNDGTLISTIYKYNDNEKFEADLTTNYYSYVNKIATEETTTGYNEMAKQISQNQIENKQEKRSYFKRKTTRMLNERNDIVKYNIKEEDINEKGEIIPTDNLSLKSMLSQKILECNYKYNKKGDWTELILSEGNKKYLIVKEIEYLE